MAKKRVAFGLPGRNPKKCTINGCNKELRARSYCAGHWARWRKNGEPGGLIKLPEVQMCTIRGCYNLNAVKYRGGQCVCNKHYLRMMNTGSFELKPRHGINFDECDADGCSRPARSKHGRWCEMHYGRMRRNGTMEKKHHDRLPIGYTHEGYVWVLEPAHPLANGGRVTMHRKVLFDNIGKGPHKCRWCKMTVKWGGKDYGALVVDHVDGDKENNEIENLVPSCTPCNTSRASFMIWAAKHADDPFLQELFGHAVDGQNVRRHDGGNFRCVCA